MHSGPPTTLQEVIRGWEDRDIDKVTLTFETRLRLKNDNRLVRTCPEFATFLERVIARVNLLSGAYHGGPMLEHDAKRALLERATHVNVRSHDLVWDDWARYSGQQKEWMQFGGLLGSVTYEGELRPFMPILALGEWLHVDGKTSFGLGRYKMTCVSSKAVSNIENFLARGIRFRAHQFRLRKSSSSRQEFGRPSFRTRIARNLGKRTNYGAGHGNRISVS